MAAPNSRTTTGRRCSLYCCIDFDLGIHFTHSLNLQFFIPSALVAHPFADFPVSSAEFPVSSTTTLHPTVPNSNQNLPTIAESMVRHRMHSRRRGNQGSLSRSRHSSASKTTSSQAEQHTGRFHLVASAMPPSSFPSTFGSSPRSTPLSPPPHSQHTQFTFRSSLNQPLITATITINVHEEKKNSEAQDSEVGGRLMATEDQGETSVGCTEAMGPSNIAGGGSTIAGSSQTKAKAELAQTSRQGTEERSQEQQTRRTWKEVETAPQMNWVIEEYCCIIEEEQLELQAGDTETSPLPSGNMDEHICFIVEEHPPSPPPRCRVFDAWSTTLLPLNVPRAYLVDCHSACHVSQVHWDFVL